MACTLFRVEKTKRPSSGDCRRPVGNVRPPRTRRPRRRTRTPSPRTPIPGPPVRTPPGMAAAKRETREAYRGEYANRGRTALQGRGGRSRSAALVDAKSNPAATRLVLLREACNLYASCGDMPFLVLTAEDLAQR